MIFSFFFKIQLYVRYQLLRFKQQVKNIQATTKAQLGQKGEEAAANYLIYHKGFKMLMRNWRYKSDEIDLIALDPNGMLVFIEVRTRSTGTLEDAYRSITWHKKRALKRACLAYLRNLTKLPTSYRFDIVVIQVTGSSNYSFHHFENIPLFSIPFRSVQNPYA